MVIAQRKLLAFGKVASKEREVLDDIWVTVDETFNISDPSIRKDFDYHELTYDQRAFNLDTVSVPRGHLVTGVRFHVRNDHISLQVRATEFNYATGQLENIENSQWMSNLNGGKNKISTEGTRDRTTSPKYVSYTTADPYVEFGPGLYDHENPLKHITVPFLDPFSGEPDVPTILGGVGFYLIGLPEYASIIAVKLVVYEENLAFTLD